MTMTTAALLSSCGLYKSYERPADIQTDGLYRSDNTQSGDSLGLASFAWREIFTDPQLQTLIERGLAQNTNLRSATCFPASSTLGNSWNKEMAYQLGKALGEERLM